MKFLTAITSLIIAVAFLALWYKGCEMNHETLMETIRYNRYICETKGVCVNTPRYGASY